ncbi:MAG: DUF998 domain-containing protein [Promethearchaeota archaeon]
MEKLERFYEKFPGSYVALLTVVWVLVFHLISIILYNDPNYSLFTNYISDLGASKSGSVLFWSINMIIASPIRVLIGLYLLGLLAKRGANEKYIKITANFIVIGAIGSILIALNPHDTSRTFHLIGAFTYFIGVVFIQTFFYKMELNAENIPKYLPFISILVVVIYFTFLGLEIVVLVTGSLRELACFSEWMALFSLMAWLGLHGYYTYQIK